MKPTIVIIIISSIIVGGSIVGGIIDVGVVFIDLSVASCGTYEDSPITITLENLGTEAVSDIPITLYVDGEEIVTEIIDATLEMSAEIFWPIETAVDLSSPEGHEVMVTVTLPLDENPENDSFSRLAGIAGITEPLPYFQDFEAGLKLEASRGISRISFFSRNIF